LNWSTACPDWAERLKSGKSIIPSPIFPSEAERALEIFKSLTIVDLPGKPTFGECSEQWVFDFVSAVFGAYNSETGDQLIREFFMLISKKNTKSTVGAAIMLTALILCWREMEEHLILAPTKEIADNSFKPAAAMVRADPELSAIFHVQDHIRTITHRVSGNSLKTVAADTETVSGKKAGRILLDELWVWGKSAKAEGMLMEATGGQISRDEGFVISLTTQSDEPPAGVFKKKLDYFRDVRDGRVLDPKSLPIIYEFPQEMIDNKEYEKPENFYISNPNIGRSVSKVWLEDNLRKVLNDTDGGLQKFLAKHLNIEIGMNLRANRWAGADFWAGAVQPVSLDELLSRSEVVTIGIDGGGLDDLLGFYVIGREATAGVELQKRKKLGWGYAWAHPSVLERRKEIAPALRDFVNQGHMSIVENVGDDIEQMADTCERIFETGLLYQIGVDPIGLGSIEESLAERGIDADTYIRAVAQGWKLGGAIKTVERWLASGEMIPSDQPMMAWQVGNARIEPRANGILITKQASGFAKIDCLIACLNSATLMANNPPVATGKYQMFVLG
jgi:phage terminase large subunit-like protein